MIYLLKMQVEKFNYFIGSYPSFISSIFVEL